MIDRQLPIDTLDQRQIQCRHVDLQLRQQVVQRNHRSIDGIRLVQYQIVGLIEKHEQGRDVLLQNTRSNGVVRINLGFFCVKLPASRVAAGGFLFLKRFSHEIAAERRFRPYLYATRSRHIDIPLGIHGNPVDALDGLCIEYG